MILYRLSLLRYLKEKTKEVFGFSGFCKGDIFLNPALKAGRDILREGVYDDHIIHAIRHFAGREGYAACYGDLNAGFGAIACAVAPLFKTVQLCEADDALRAVLTVNIGLKASGGGWEVHDAERTPSGPCILRCDRATETVRQASEAVIILQAKDALPMHFPGHDIYAYGAGMDKTRPFLTLWRLLTQGYVFRLRKVDSDDAGRAGDYICLPKGMAV
ncbi:hypothetical protein [Paremcibacter congregatus]|uniref:hypothetical protein n=1 Tax=Paremcibacter congregatus TaxID=2043170 RepID=UPI0030EB1E36|tara:strand:- start:4753 stop:5403 length:651 start_codon:yes stop_codon:yes gene_type:complete